MCNTIFSRGLFFCSSSNSINFIFCFVFSSQQMWIINGSQCASMKVERPLLSSRKISIFMIFCVSLVWKFAGIIEYSTVHSPKIPNLFDLRPISLYKLGKSRSFFYKSTCLTHIYKRTNACKLLRNFTRKLQPHCKMDFFY